MEEDEDFIFNMVKDHVAFPDEDIDDLIREAINEAENQADYSNNNGELIAFVSGYVLATKNAELKKSI